MSRIGVDIKPSVSPIFPIKIRDNKRVKDIAAQLLENGIYAIGICYPTVRDKDARIRASILSTHSSEDIIKFANTLAEILY